MSAAVALLISWMTYQGQQDADPSPLELTDLADYRAALNDTDQAPAPLVRFRDLWDHPDAHIGRRVEIEGRQIRAFRQPATGTFPALTEAWIDTGSANLVCVVHPSETSRSVTNGDRVRFRGTFLRTIRYRAGDSDRMAPWLVGPKPPALQPEPVSTEITPPPTNGWPSMSNRVVVGGMFLTIAFALGLAWWQMRSPRTRPVTKTDAPIFDLGTDPAGASRYNGEDTSSLPFDRG